MPQHPRSFSHIGLSVPDVDAAVEFYSAVLDFSTHFPQAFGTILRFATTAIKICLATFAAVIGKRSGTNAAVAKARY